MNPYKVCDKIIEYLIKDGYRYQIHQRDLEKAIMVVRGVIDERSIKRWIKALETFGYIERKTAKVYELTRYALSLSHSQILNKQTKMM